MARVLCALRCDDVPLGGASNPKCNDIIFSVFEIKEISISSKYSFLVLCYFSLANHQSLVLFNSWPVLLEPVTYILHAQRVYFTLEVYLSLTCVQLCQGKNIILQEAL